jgi:hypothetical protein
MAPASRPFDCNPVSAAILVAAGVCALAGAALAAPRWPHRAISAAQVEDGRHGDAPRIARYQIDDGGVFVLDRSSGQVLLRFDDNPEIWVLSPSHGPRGDIIYKNDLGEPVLRATRLGGVTVFTQRRPDGSAASLWGPSTALRLTPIGPLALYQRLFQDSIRSTRAAQHLIEFDAPDVDATSEILLADAATVATTAMVALSARADGRPVLARVSKIAFSIGARPAVMFKDGVVQITLVPSLGIAGRPSSRRIASALGGVRP